MSLERAVTTLLFAHAHSLHNSILLTFQFFAGYKVLKICISFSKYTGKQAQL